MLEIRMMEEKDLDQVAAIEADLFSMPWSRNGFAESMELPHTLFLTAVMDGRVAGYCGFFQSFDEADITNVAVSLEFQGQGIGSDMLKALLLLGKERGIVNYTLEVRLSNTSAIHVYEKLGFEREGIRKNFYEKPTEDALIMWKREEMA